jgi:hypothetical protein
MDFDGFYNLMNHRKKVHPSYKKCRNFSSGKCTFGVDCWYVHGEETEDTLDRFRCELCEEEFKGRRNFMHHKKLYHPDNVPVCEKFITNKCSRNSKECWFEHKVAEKNTNDDSSWPKLVPNSSSKPESPVFREVTGHALPPDQVSMMMEMVGNLCKKMESMEEKFKMLMTK